MVLDLVVAVVVGFVLGRLAAGFASLAGVAVFALWLLDRAIPPGVFGVGGDLVGLVVAPGNELLFVAAVLVGVGSTTEE